MSPSLDEIRASIRSGDVKTALLLIARRGEEEGYSPRLLVLKATCLQLSDDAPADAVEATLLRAIELDDEYVPGFLELGWFRLNVQDDAIRAKHAFDRARDLLKNLTAEAFRGSLACAQDLRPNQSEASFRSEFEQDLIQHMSDKSR